MSPTKWKVFLLAGFSLLMPMVDAYALDAKEGEKVILRGKILFDRQWRTEGIVPYRLQVKSPLRITGDGEVCDSPKIVTELDLFDARESAYKSFAGREVVVEGMIDCPRGGYVIRDFSIKLQ